MRAVSTGFPALFSERVRTRVRAPEIRAKWERREEKNGPDLAGQNDTSYQSRPTGLLHGDKLHLHFNCFALSGGDFRYSSIQKFLTRCTLDRVDIRGDRRKDSWEMPWGRLIGCRDEHSWSLPHVRSNFWASSSFPFIAIILV